MPKKKIGLFLNFPPHGGGTFQYGLSILEFLSQSNSEFDLEILTQGQDWETHLNQFKVQALQIPKENSFWKWAWRFWKSFRLPLSIWRKFLAPVHPLGKIFAQEPERLWVFPSQDTIPVKFPIRGIVSIHDLMHIYENQFHEVGSWLERIRRNWNYQKICEFAEVILVDSQIGKEHVLNNFVCSEQKVKVIPFTVPYYLRCLPQESQKPSILEPYFFYPAQFWEHKNHLRLIEAFAQIVDLNSEVKLVLTGSRQNAYQKVVQRIADLNLENRVQILGYVSDSEMATLYKHSLALVFPTFFGPTNIPPLEALYLGCPVICSDIYGMREVLGDQVHYIDPTSVESIYLGMRKVLESPQESVQFPTELSFESFSLRLKAILVET